MPIYSLRKIGTADRDFNTVTAEVRERSGHPASVAVFPARASRRGVPLLTPDRDDRWPRSATAVSRPRWPVWTFAVAFHLAVIATLLYSAQSLLNPVASEKFEIALVFEPPPAPPSAEAAPADRPEVAPTPTAIPPEDFVPPEPSPPVAAAVEPAPVPPPTVAEQAEPPAIEQPTAPPDDGTPPPMPTAKPAPERRPTVPKPAPAVARRGPAAPRPPERPSVAAETPAAAPPSAVAVIPPPAVRSTPVANLSRNRKPDYPAEARRRGLQGRTLLRVEVSAAGAAIEIQVVASSGYTVLDQAALAAVREWRFDPATIDGKPVSGAVEVPIRFRLDD